MRMCIFLAPSSRNALTLVLAVVPRMMESSITLQRHFDLKPVCQFIFLSLIRINHRQDDMRFLCEL